MATTLSGRAWETSPRLIARAAGVLYFVALAAAMSEELLLHGKVAAGVGLVALSCNMTVSVMMYLLIKPISKSLAVIAVLSNLAGLTCEAFHWQPHGTDLGLVFHGGYCILIGYLVFESDFLPRVFGVLMIFSGCAWLTYAYPPFANRLSPYNLGVALLGEASLMVWLIAKGVNAERWKMAS